MAELNIVDTDPGGDEGQILTPYLQTLVPGYSFGTGNGYLEFGSGTPGALPFRVDQAGNVTAANVVPTAQTFPLANDAYQTLQQWTVTGQTDSPLPPFGLVAGSQTYGTSPAIQGPAFWFGYNPALLSASVASSPHGAAGMSVFGDAGDSNNGAGGHGLECNPATFRTPNGTGVTNAFQMVAIDDNTNTVNTVIRCGTGTVNGISSGITLQRADASVTYMIMGPVTSDEIAVSRPMALAFDTNALGNPISISNTNTAAGSATFTLDCNNASGLDEMVFRQSGVNKWATGYSAALAGWYYVEDMVNSRFPFRIAPGASAVAQQITADGQLTVTNSLVVSSGAALATTATDGFLYLPTCAGAPTGAPTAKTGSAACVFDTTDSKIWVWNGSWKGVVVS